MQYLLRAETREEANEWAVDLAIHTGRESALDRNNRIPGHAGPVAEQALADPEADPTFIKKVAGDLYVSSGGLGAGDGGATAVVLRLCRGLRLTCRARACVWMGAVR